MLSDMASREIKRVLDEARATGEDFVPWARLPGDSPTSWRGFVYYRDLGHARTVPAVAKFLQCSVHNAYHLYIRYEWKARAVAYDSYCDREYRKEVDRERIELAKQHVSAAKKLRLKAMEALDLVPPEYLAAKPEHALAVLKEAIRLEQQLYGIRPLNEGETTSDKDPIGDYLDERPLPELLAMAKETVLTLEAKLARQQRVEQDGKVIDSE